MNAGNLHVLDKDITRGRRVDERIETGSGIFVNQPTNSQRKGLFGGNEELRVTNGERSH